MNIKKQVSMSKFVRIRGNPLAKSCHTYRYRHKSYQPEISIEAYHLGDFVYALYPNNKQGGHRLQCHCVRYWVGDHCRADLFSYVYTIDSRV